MPRSKAYNQTMEDRRNIWRSKKHPKEYKVFVVSKISRTLPDKLHKCFKAK